MTVKHVNKQLLVIGPLPPPLAGTSVSFKLFCDYLDKHADTVGVKVLNTAPKKLGTRPLFDLGNLATASRVLWGCLMQIRQSERVVLFGSNQLLLSLMPICLLIARLFGKKFYVRSFGGSLDSYYQNLSPLARRFFTRVLNNVDGLIVQTASLKAFFGEFMGSRVHLVPGYREPSSFVARHKEIDRVPQVIKLVYVGHIQKPKGIFELLQSIKLLNASQPLKVSCDFYGPVYDEDSANFTREVALTKGARYGGVLDPEQVIQTIADYDVFVFPTYYKGEGHPGVLIEAMMAGLPIISTRFKSIPDLIQAGYNGLLVTPNSPQELAEAIDALRNDGVLLAKLKEQSRQSGTQYHSDSVIPLILKAIDIETK